LPTGDSPGPTGDLADPVAVSKAYVWTDFTLSKRTFPYSTAQRLDAWPVGVLRPRAVDALGRAGFAMVLDRPPVFPTHVKPGKPPRTVQGIVVAERGLRIDVVRRRRAYYRMLGFVALGAVGLVVAFGDLASRSASLIGTLVGGVSLGAALASIASGGQFDSEVAGVVYSTTLDAAAAPPTLDTPLTLDVRVFVGKVASANWASKTASGRSFKTVLPTDPGLRNVPDDVLRQILG
jgi:hypothetical protein